MSGSQSSNHELVEELLDFCQSESLSEDGLRDIIERYDYDWNNIHVDRNYEFFLEACYNELVTGGILRCLLEYFPDAVNFTDSRLGLSPLHAICFNRNATRGMVQLIVDASPESLSRVDNDGWMPLHNLCNKKELEDNAASDILGLLLERCPEAARHVTNRGYLPIHSAAISKSPEFCRMLIDAYPGSERMPLSTGALPLHLACISNTVATTEYLYKLYPECIGLTDSRTGRNGAHPIHYAIEGMKERANCC
jgi:ankyrin repeat protein